MKVTITNFNTTYYIYVNKLILYSAAARITPLKHVLQVSLLPPDKYQPSLFAALCLQFPDTSSHNSPSSSAHKIHCIAISSPEPSQKQHQCHRNTCSPSKALPLTRWVLSSLKQALEVTCFHSHICTRAPAGFNRQVMVLAGEF